MLLKYKISNTRSGEKKIIYAKILNKKMAQDKKNIAIFVSEYNFSKCVCVCESSDCP